MAGPHGRQAGSADCVDTLISCSPSEESASLYIYLHNTDGERVERETSEYGYSISQSNLPHRYGNSHAIWDHITQC